jgi:L-malate glycosyltransferase
VSETSASDFATLFPQFSKRIVTIPIGIEEPDLAAIPKPLPAAGRPVKIIHVGGFSFEKNHRGLISIFEKLVGSGVRATLEMVGNGPLKQEMEELVSHKGLSDKVTFHGFRNNAMELIRQADVLVLPSIIEGLPGVILEAFYCRTPVVANRVGGIGEIVINNETGFLVEKNDEEGFVTAIKAAAAAQQSPMVGKAYDLVTTSYLNTGIAEKFIAAYTRLLASSK